MPAAGPTVVANGDAAPAHPGGLPRALWIALLAFSFALRALALARPIASLDGVIIPDDSYYTLHLARSIAHGLGPFYGLGHTNGFQPLFGFLMVPFFWLFDDPLRPVRAALVVSALADTAALAVLAAILRRQVSDARVVAAVMVMWAVSPYAISHGTNGLETSLALFFLLSAAAYFQRTQQPEASPRVFFLFGVLGGLALFARIDSGILLAVAAALSLRPLLARGPSVAIRAALATAAGVVVVNLPWWLYSYRYTGRIYPVSGRAVRHISTAAIHHHVTLKNFVIPEIKEGIRVLLVNHWPLLLVLAALVALILLRDGRAGGARLLRELGRQRLLVVHAAVLFAAYTLYVYTEWFFPRYFYPIHAVLLLATGIALDRWLAVDTVSQTGKRRRVLALVIGFMAVSLGRKDFRDIYLTDDPPRLASMNIALWAKEHLPAGTVVGCPQSGGLGYFADHLTVVNLDGVVNQDAYVAMMKRRLLDYIREVKIGTLLTWSSTIDLIREESSGMRPDDVTLQMDLPTVRTYGKSWHVYRVNPANGSPGNQ